MAALPWLRAWHEALYAAERGFYAQPTGPAAHFTTATHGPTGAVLAEALLALWLSTHETLPSVIVDVGAGRGELTTHLLHSLEVAPGPDVASRPELVANRPAELASRPEDRVNRPEDRVNRPWGGAGDRVVAARVVAADVIDRPAGLDERIEWLRSPGGADLPDELTDVDDALVIAHEWLDVVPCTVARVAADLSIREVLVDPSTGVEVDGDVLAGDRAAWIEDHWAAGEPGDRIEVGLARDDAWRGLVERVRSGTVVAVDYGHTRTARPREGTLTAYAAGRQLAPVPDGSCDITAHVAMDTLDVDRLVTQRDALSCLGFRGERPSHASALADPAGYLRALERASAEAALIRKGGFGDFWWAVKHVPAAT